ncbi:MAG: NfeD family protein [Oscillospiraceae bacterium]|jgi:membrane protein implicated in regulation of membrane protease activity|nr:NfeD family protein [Oscillospiraceae bacterium]
MEYIWVLWLVLMVACLVLESLSMQLFSIWFAVGALAALIAALADLPIGVQIVLFVAATAASLIATRPLVRKLMKKQIKPTNADRNIGKTGIVTEEINLTNGTGRVSLEGQDWSARTADSTVITEGVVVVARSIEGNKLIVESAP